MHPHASLTNSVFLPAESDTVVLGEALARAVCPGESLFLHGELGAGKSTLARAFLRGLGWTGPVRSPSYALIHSYRAGGRTIHHLDLYRISSVEEAVGLDLDEIFSPEASCLVEWPDRLGDSRTAQWEVRLEMEDDGRRAFLQAPAPHRLEAILAPHRQENPS